MFLVDRIKNPTLKEAADWGINIGIAILIAFFITTFIVQRTVVNKYSMNPTLYENENLIVEKLTTRFGTLKRGDIVTIFAPKEQNEDEITIIKRVIAFEGEHVQIKDGKVYINDKELVENYVGGYPTSESGKYCDIVVPKDNIYVLGDNRNKEIIDSRNIGPINKKYFTGRAIVKVFPFTSFKIFKNPFN